MADTTTLLTRAEAEQRDFVEVLRELTPEQWAAQSLCPKWTVRETVMHTAIHTHQTLRESVKANREAVRRRDEPTDTLVDSLAAPLYAKSPWELRLQLGELLIHQQDVRRPLDLPRDIPADRLVAVLRTCLGRGDGLIIGVKARKHSPRAHARRHRSRLVVGHWARGARAGRGDPDGGRGPCAGSRRSHGRRRVDARRARALTRSSSVSAPISV